MRYLPTVISVLAVIFAACGNHSSRNSSAAAAEAYVALLKADKYPRYEVIPPLEPPAIAVLMQYAGDSSLIQNYPIPAYSAVAYGPQQVGMIIMYTIESIRLQRKHGASSIPYARDTAAPRRKATAAELAPLYARWWEENKDQPADSLQRHSPLAGSPFSWD